MSKKKKTEQEAAFPKLQSSNCKKVKVRYIYATDFFVTIEEIRYKWVGCFGCVLESYEYGIQPKTVRIIGGTIFHARTVEQRLFRKSRICWVPQESINVDWIQEFKKDIFK